MKPVDQNKFGVGQGNCFSACVASLLELPLADVPYFMGEEDWLPGFAMWLEPRGFYPVIFGLALAEEWRPMGLHILGGIGPRGAHAVVARGSEVVHDPHPSREGLTILEDVTILVPLDPARSK